jgi:hypothetical protein
MCRISGSRVEVVLRLALKLSGSGSDFGFGVVRAIVRCFTFQTLITMPTLTSARVRVRARVGVT